MASEGMIRLGVFLGILAVMAAWEVSVPKRRIEIPRLIRWSNNFGLVVIDTLLVRLAFPAGAVGASLWASAHGWGLFNLVPLPAWQAVLFSLLLLDLAIYAQHVVFHFVPALWRLHRVHHADTAIDVSTGLRFHPLEILLSMLIKVVIVVLLGAPAVAVLLFEVILNGTAMFNHANIRLPRALDRLLRLVVVTPDMHRVHHSADRRETDSNFGFNLPWWDRLFGTYIDQPSRGHEEMVIGLDRFRDRREQYLDRMLVQPFRGDSGRARKSSR